MLEKSALMLHECPNVTSCALMFLLVALMLLYEVTLGQTPHFSCALMLPCCPAIDLYNLNERDDSRRYFFSR